MSNQTKKVSNRIFFLVGIQIAIIVISYIVLDIFESETLEGNSVAISGKNRFLTEMVLNTVKDYYIGGKLTGDPISALGIYEKNLQLLKTGGTQMGMTLSPLPEKFHGQWENIHNLYLDYKTKIQSFVKSDSANYRETELVEISDLANKSVEQNRILTNQLGLDIENSSTMQIWLHISLAIINIGVLLLMTKLVYNTLKKRAEQLIKIEKEMAVDRKFKILYEEMPDLCRTINEKGIILDCNMVYAKSLGYSKEEVIGKSIFDHVAEKSQSALYESFEMWKNKGIAVSKEIWFKRKDGSIFPTLIRATNLVDENGKRIGSNTVIRDISNIYDVKKELDEQKLKRLSTIGELSSRIAHDIKNPLSVIKNTVELMQMRDPHADETDRRCFDRLERAVTRIRHQVDDVLDFVKSTNLVLKNYTMSEVLNAALDRMIIPDGVNIKLPKNDVNIVCDAEKLEVVFANLITNAIQAMNNEGEINIRIIDDDPVLITVNDHGSGISDEILPKIFDPLFTTKQTGTGLGLASCRNIVEQHEGKIWAKSEVGKGTTMHVVLPKKVNIQQPIVE